MKKDFLIVLAQLKTVYESRENINTVTNNDLFGY